MKKNILILGIAMLSLQACDSNKGETPVDKQPENETKLSQLSWMLGSWGLSSPEVSVTENWQQSSDQLYNGNSFVVSAKGDTMFTEQLSLQVENDTVYYIPVLKDQNDGKPVRFKAVTLSENKVVFENLQHDFPQRIVYEKTSDSTLYAYIEGMQNGQLKKEEFPYTRR